MRLGAFGDVVRTLPAAFALRRRFPKAHLAWLVEPGAAPLLARLPWLDAVVIFPRAELEAALEARQPGRLLGRAARVRSELRHLRIDTVVDFHGILKSALLSSFTGARRRVGFARPEAKEAASAFYTEHVAMGAQPVSRWARNAALAEALGARVDAAPIPGLADERPGAGAPKHAVLHPGSSPATKHKRYPVARFAEVARGVAELLGAPCLVTTGAGSEERRNAAAIVAGAGGSARLVETDGHVDRLIATLAGAAVVVGGDTGPLHLASLLGTPVVQILGPTHPVQNEPWPETPWARAHLPLPCSPCRRGCAAAPCLASLPASDVVAATRRVLADASSARAVGRASAARPTTIERAPLRWEAPSP